MLDRLRALGGTLEAAWADWAEIRLAELQFAQLPLAQRITVILIGVAMAVLALRFVVRASAWRGRVALPAIVGFRGAHRLSIARHGALLLGLAEEGRKWLLRRRAAAGSDNGRRRGEGAATAAAAPLDLPPARRQIEGAPDRPEPSP